MVIQQRLAKKNDHKRNTPDQPRHPLAEFKYEALRRCFELGEDAEYASREIGYSRMSIYVWRRKKLKHGMIGLMAKRKSIPRKPLPQGDTRPQSEEMQALQEQIQNLQFEVDVLKEPLAVLKKDPGVDLTALKNREKAVIIGALREKYALPILLTHFHMAEAATTTSKLLCISRTNIFPFVRRSHQFFSKTEGYMVIAVFIWR